MKLTRRSAMGALAAGVTTAKQASQEIAKQFVNTVPMSTGQMIKNYGGECDKPKMELEQDLLKRIAEVQKVANGEFYDWQKERLENDWSESARDMDINSLKSISDGQRRRMHVENQKGFQKKRWIKEAQDTLKHLLMEKARRGIFG